MTLSARLVVRFLSMFSSSILVLKIAKKVNIIYLYKNIEIGIYIIHKALQIHI